MILNRFCLLMALGFLFAPAAWTDDAKTSPRLDSIEGVWVTADGDGYIEIRRRGEIFEGTIIGGPNDDDRLDTKNPDPKLRGQKLTGLRILDGLKAVGKSKWTGGRIYDPNNGKTYDCSVELEDQETLKVRGFIGISLLGRTERWSRKSSGS